MRRSTLLLALVLLYAAVFRLLALDRPFLPDAEGSGSMYGILARNYRRFDWTQTYGIPVLTVGQPRARRENTGLYSTDEQRRRMGCLDGRTPPPV